MKKPRNQQMVYFKPKDVPPVVGEKLVTKGKLKRPMLNLKKDLFRKRDQ